ncbi:MAG: hypothetical protein QM715_20145 [Nibricoccus sp.]
MPEREEFPSRFLANQQTEDTHGMKRTLFVLAALMILATASFVLWHRQAKPLPLSGEPATTKAQTSQPTTPAIDTRVTETSSNGHPSPAPTVEPSNATIVLPFANSSAVKNEEGLVTRETADLGDGRGLLDRRFHYDDKGQLTREARLNPATGQLIETLEYVRTEDGKINTRVTDAAGNITAITPDGKIIRPDGAVAN